MTGAISSTSDFPCSSLAPKFIARRHEVQFVHDRPGTCVPLLGTGLATTETDCLVPGGVPTMGLRERLQAVTQFFQNAATRGHQLRQEEERGENGAPSAGEQSRQLDEPRGDGTTAEDRDRERVGQ